MKQKCSLSEYFSYYLGAIKAQMAGIDLSICTFDGRKYSDQKPVEFADQRDQKVISSAA